jgi:Na+(H+)/acetate symporter ActP
MYCTFTGKTFISPYFTSPINAGVLAMVLGLVIVPVVSLITKVTRKEDVERMFNCYKGTVTVHVTTALEEGQE